MEKNEEIQKELLDSTVYIRSGYLPNKSLECHSYTHLLGNLGGGEEGGVLPDVGTKVIYTRLWVESRIH
jgi:hypothetical protein